MFPDGLHFSEMSYISGRREYRILVCITLRKSEIAQKHDFHYMMYKTKSRSETNSLDQETNIFFFFRIKINLLVNPGLGGIQAGYVNAKDAHKILRTGKLAVVPEIHPFL